MMRVEKCQENFAHARTDVFRNVFILENLNEWNFESLDDDPQFAWVL